MQYCAYCGNAVEAVSFASCPRCGNPTNGSPRRVAPKGTNTALIVIIVVVGLLVIVAFAGIIAAIAIPNYLTAIERSKQKRTMAGILTFGAALESYASDNNEYPKDPAGLTEALVPKYVKTVPRVDGWGHELQYICLKSPTEPQSEKCVGYVIGSAGKDGRFEHESLLDALAAQGKNRTSNFDCDIVFSNGTFMEYPVGAQH